MPDRLRTLTEFARAEYERPSHGDCHLRMSDLTYAAVKARHTTPAPAPRPSWIGQRYADLVATPIRLDESVPFGCWRLAKNADPEEVVESGIAVPGIADTERDAGDGDA